MKISIGGQAIGIGGTPLALPLPRITVDGVEFVRQGVRFKGWGFQQYNYDFVEEFYASSDMDDTTHLAMANTFTGDRINGANVIRLRLELWSFIEGTEIADLAVKSVPMANLIFALNAARDQGLYILLNGCNVVRPPTVPAWYDDLTYLERWDVQEFFWSSVAAAVYAAGHSTTLLGYDLINEPFISTDPDADWYGPAFFGSGDHFTALIARGPGVDSTTVRAWITLLRDAIKTEDPRALVTFGALPFYTGPVGVSNTQDLLDFLSPHLYPPAAFFDPATLAERLAIIAGFAAATIPNVVGETLPWGTESDNDAVFDAFNDGMQALISFSYGYGPEYFTTPPEAPRYPASADGSPAVMEIHRQFLASFDEFRAGFLAE